MRSYRIETDDRSEQVTLVELWSPQNTEPTYAHTFATWSDAANAVRTVGGHLAYTLSESVPRLVMFS